MEELLRRASAEPALVAGQALHVLPRLMLALALASVLAYRPWRRRARPRGDMIQTQILMCVAGALIASVIGDSLARAFGVVGLGGFIRFRSGLKDPRDAATLFVLIGLGMACGLGAYEVAVAGWVFMVGIFLVLDLARSRGGGERFVVTLEAEDPAGAESASVAALQAEGLRVSRVDVEPAAGRVRLAVEGAEGVADAIGRLPLQRIRSIAWERAADPPGNEPRPPGKGAPAAEV